MSGWRSADDDAVRALASTFRGAARWLRVASPQRLAEDLGWTVVDVRGYVAIAEAGLDLDGGGRADLMYEDGTVTWIGLCLADVVRPETAASREFLNDVFVHVAALLRAQWGQPTDARGGAEPSLVWRFPDVVTEAYLDPTAVNLAVRLTADLERQEYASSVD